MELRLSLPGRKKLVLTLSNTIPRRRRQISMPLFGIIFFILTIGLRYPPGRRKKVKPLTLNLPGKRRLSVQPAVLTAVISLIIGSAGVVYFGSLVARPALGVGSFSPPAVVIQKAKPAIHASPSLPRSLPQSLRISAVGINAPFVEIGRQADDTLAVPNGYDIVGWYNGSPTPGEIGPAVVVGHLDSPRNVAVFWRLHELQLGQIIEITRADGSMAKFKVDEVNQFAQEHFPTDRVYGAINYAGLRLVTCGGQFNRATQHYSHNTVIFASFVP